MKLLIQIIVGVSSYAFIISTLFGAGLGLSVKEISDPLKKIKITASVLIANFLLIPALAVALSSLFNLDYGLKAGLLIVACCAGAPFLPRLIIKAHGNIPHTVGVMVLLIGVTVVYAPAVLPFALPGITLRPLRIAALLFTLMLLPLILGLVVHARKPQLALRIRRFTDIAASVAIVIILIFGLAVDYKYLASAYGTGVYIHAGLFTLLTLLLGYAVSGKSREEKVIMVFSSGARNIPAAVLIAVTGFSDTRIVSVVLICCLFQFAGLSLLANICGKKAA